MIAILVNLILMLLVIWIVKTIVDELELPRNIKVAITVLIVVIFVWRMLL